MPTSFTGKHTVARHFEAVVSFPCRTTGAALVHQSSAQFLRVAVLVSMKLMQKILGGSVSSSASLKVRLPNGTRSYQIWAWYSLHWFLGLQIPLCIWTSHPSMLGRDNLT